MNGKSTSSSLAINLGSILGRHGNNGLLKNKKNRSSKQTLTEGKMFGSRFGRHGKDFQIGKKFGKKKGSGSRAGGRFGNFKSGGISPSVDEFDKMMSKVSGRK